MNLRLALVVFAAFSLWACSQGGEGGNAGSGAGGGVKAGEKAPEPARVEDGRTYVLSRPQRWKAGDVVTNTATVREHHQIKRIASDGFATPLPDIEKRTDAIWLEQTQAVDDDGARSRYLVWIRSWSHQDGDKNDNSLNGAYVQVSGTGQSRTWSLLDQAGIPTEVARKWLDEALGSGRLGVEETDRMILHAGSVAVGASWRPDAAPLLEWAAAHKLQVDPEQVTASAKLVGVTGSEGHVSFETALPLSNVPDSTTAWTKGGTLAITGDARFPIDGTQVDFHLDRHVVLDGVATIDGSKVHVTLQIEDTLERATGGNFVAPAGAAAVP